jgi:hypothetical protein
VLMFERARSPHAPRRARGTPTPPGTATSGGALEKRRDYESSRTFFDAARELVDDARALTRAPSRFADLGALLGGDLSDPGRHGNTLDVRPVCRLPSAPEISGVRISRRTSADLPTVGRDPAGVASSTWVILLPRNRGPAARALPGLRPARSA